MRILQSVASGLLGKPAFDEEPLRSPYSVSRSISLSLFHGQRSSTWPAESFPALTRHPVIAGLFYGFLIYAVMNLVVLPLSAYPRKVSFPLLVLVTGLLVHMFCIGLPISLAGVAPQPEGT